MDAPRIKVTIAPWLATWLAGYVQRCHDRGEKPDFGLMKMMARCVTGVR
jgi:hypothetical protein